MARVLIAADESEAAVDAARVAHELFGDSSEYLLIHVGEVMDGALLAWGQPFPIEVPMAVYPTAMPESQDERVTEAEDRAAETASEADLEAEPVGAVGDPADAILTAARRYRVDVIVVASHERSWFSRLLRPSVTHDLLRDATIPVLVVK